MKNNIYVDFHVVQTVPPSCLNRDDIGSPKTAVYGGVTRARVSSQSWKHVIRQYFREKLAMEDLGNRTKFIKQLVADKITSLQPDADAEKLAEKILKTAGFSVGKDDKISVLFFISDTQAEALAKLALEGSDDKKKCQAVLQNHPAIDMALFGRMVASDAQLNVDACCQVAHAISTHEVKTEYDYFTAVDDYAPEDTSGAGHLGTVEFNSSTLYRYATINIGELNKALKDQTIEALNGFAEAFIFAMPTGKQNTFANRTVPDLVYITIRDDQPVNLAGAFEKPVRAERAGYVGASVDALIQYAEKVYEFFAEKPLYAYGVDGERKIEKIAAFAPVKSLLEQMSKDILPLIEVYNG